MDRIRKLCAYLDSCATFADVGCDHGYCTEYMLKNNLCDSAYVSDISAKCLSKAENALKRYIEEGRVTPVCCSGLEKIPPSCDQVLIAGMGGEEITAILKAGFVPERFVLQPMKNVRAVREFLLNAGAEITADEAFLSGDKFYFVIKGVKHGNKQAYSEIELDYGKLPPKGDTKLYLQSELNKKLEYLERRLSGFNREKIEREIERIREVLKSESL